MITLTIFVVRIFMKSSTNPMSLENIPIFPEFSKALDYVTEYMEIHQLSIKENTMNSQNRYYVYEDFIGEQFIWIEKHEINI